MTKATNSSKVVTPSNYKDAEDFVRRVASYLRMDKSSIDPPLFDVGESVRDNVPEPVIRMARNINNLSSLNMSRVFDSFTKENEFQDALLYELAKALGCQLEFNQNAKEYLICTLEEGEVKLLKEWNKLPSEAEDDNVGDAVDPNSFMDILLLYQDHWAWEGNLFQLALMAVCSCLEEEFCNFDTLNVYRSFSKWIVWKNISASNYEIIMKNINGQKDLLQILFSAMTVRYSMNLTFFTNINKLV